MTLTAAANVNAATALIGGFNDNEPITGGPPNFDSSAVGLAAGAIYNQTVQTVGKMFGWDFARNFATLVPTGNTPPFGWVVEYVYPTSGIEVRQITLNPLAALNTDPNNPAPTRWTVGNNLVASVPTKVIWCNIPNALAVISGQPPEALWDALFVETFVRQLASGLAMALEGRPNTGEAELERARGFEQLGEKRAG